MSHVQAFSKAKRLFHSMKILPSVFFTHVSVNSSMNRDKETNLSNEMLSAVLRRKMMLKIQAIKQENVL